MSTAYLDEPFNRPVSANKQNLKVKLAERFPRIEHANVSIEFIDNHGRLAQRRSRNLFASSEVSFGVPCPLDGEVFDLESVISEMVKSGSEHTRQVLDCRGWRGDYDCHHRLICEISIKYTA